MRLDMTMPDHWALISAEVAGNSQYANQKATEYLRSALERDGYAAQPVLDCFEGTLEHSYFVSNMSAFSALEYGVRFAQKVVLTHAGMLHVRVGIDETKAIKSISLTPFKPDGDWTLLQNCGLYLKVEFE